MIMPGLVAIHHHIAGAYLLRYAAIVMAWRYRRELWRVIHTTIYRL
jgi:hypothetical protein